MPKKSAVQFTLAAAILLAVGTSPALAKGGTRSGHSLPEVHASSALRAPARVNVSALASSSRHNKPEYHPPIFGNPGNGGNGGGFGGYGGLSFLFRFLPPQVQAAIADALGQAGPRGEQLCRLLGIPQCQLPDSTG